MVASIQLKSNTFGRVYMCYKENAPININNGIYMKNVHFPVELCNRRYIKCSMPHLQGILTVLETGRAILRNLWLILHQVRVCARAWAGADDIGEKCIQQSIVKCVYNLSLFLALFYINIISINKMHVGDLCWDHVWSLTQMPRWRDKIHYETNKTSSDVSTAFAICLIHDRILPLCSTFSFFAIRIVKDRILCLI